VPSGTFAANDPQPTRSSPNPTHDPPVFHPPPGANGAILFELAITEQEERPLVTKFNFKEIRILVPQSEYRRLQRIARTQTRTTSGQAHHFIREAIGATSGNAQAKTTRRPEK